MNSRDVVYGYGVGYNDGLNDSDGKKAGILKAVVDSGGGLSIVLIGKESALFTYTYNSKTVSESVTTSVTSGDTTTTHTQSFSHSLIDELFNSEGVTILKAVYKNESKGIVSHYLDEKQGVISIDSVGEVIGSKNLSANADAVAIAYAIAKNTESASALTAIKKAYRDGLKDGIDVADDDDLTEDYTDPNDEPFSTETDEDGKVTDPFIGDLTNGLWFYEPDGSGGYRYVHMWLDMSYREEIPDYFNFVKQGQIVYDAYDSDGTLIANVKTDSLSDWGWKSINDRNEQHVVNITVNGSGVSCVHQTTYKSDGSKSYTRLDWSPRDSTIAQIMNNSTVRSSVPMTNAE